MIRIAYWAKKQPAKARLLIAFLHLFIIACCYLLCQEFRAIGINISSFPLLLFAAIGFASAILLGKNINASAKSLKTRWWLQRSRFFVMNFSCTLFIIFYFCHTPEITLPQQAKAIFTKTVKELKPQETDYTNKAEYFKDLAIYYKSLSKKNLRKELRHDLKKLDKHNESFGHIMLVILFVLFIFSAMFTVVVLSCALLCTGYGFLALLSITTGSGLIVLFIFLFNKLEKKRRAKIEARQKDKLQTSK